MRLLRKTLAYLFGAVAVIAIGLAASVYFFKDRIIQQFIAEANQHLNTPITIGKIDVSVWADFPNLSIVFKDVYIEDSHPGKDTLVWARQIAFSLNPVEVWNKKYEVRGLRVNDSRTLLKINVAGKSNYNIVKESGNSSADISFNLKDVSLSNTYVSYHDRSSAQHHVFSSKKLAASIGVNNVVYKIEAQGDLTTHQLKISDRIFLKDKQFNAAALIEYDDEKKFVDIQPSTLALGSSLFDLHGTYSFLNRNEIDLEAVGKDTDIQTLISLLPKELSEQLEKYQSDGDVFFNLKLKGEISDRKSPLLSTEFGARDATVSHPGFQSVIRHANLEGSFATPSFSDLSQAELFLRNITGELNGKPFEANFSMQDFTDPLVAVDFKGDVDAASLLSFYPIPDVANLSGQLQIDFTMAGRTELLKSKATAQEVRTQGTIQMQDLHMELGKKHVKLEGLNGHLQFNHNDLALSEVRGKLENTDFLLNGYFKNLITFLLFENQPVGVEADLTSEFVDLDQLFEIGFGDRKSDDYLFQLSPYVHLNFNCNVKALSYQRFKPTRVKGNLLIKNQVAVSRDISVNALGGTISLDGLLDAKNPKAIDVVGTFKLRDVHVDSIFYLFHNFDQEFIQDKHLKGQATADVTLEMSLDEKLKLFPETLIADVSTVIKNGQLNNFEPLQQLNRYLDDEGLHKLRFADLKNDIHIENKTVFIPQMEIQSNVTTIQLSGTHTFDQHIDYRVVAPLRNKKKIDPDEAFGAIEQDSQGRTKIFLKITGTTDDYDVSLDKEAVRKKIASDFKKEVKELKDAFKLKGAKKKKELELSEEEFDWDNNR